MSSTFELYNIGEIIQSGQLRAPFYAGWSSHTLKVRIQISIDNIIDFDIYNLFQKDIV